MPTWALVLLFFAFMGALTGGYVLLVRQNTKADIEAIRQAAVTFPAACGHPGGLIPGSGRMGELRALPSSRSIGTGRTFTCPHMSISGVASASCGTCGPLSAAA